MYYKTGEQGSWEITEMNWKFPRIYFVEINSQLIV